MRRNGIRPLSDVRKTFAPTRWRFAVVLTAALGAALLASASGILAPEEVVAPWKTVGEKAAPPATTADSRSPDEPRGERPLRGDRTPRPPSGAGTRTTPECGLSRIPFSERFERVPPDFEPTRSVTELMLSSSEELREIVTRNPNPREVRSAAWAMGNRLRLEPEDVRALRARLLATDPMQADLLKTLIWTLSLVPREAPIEAIVEFALRHPDTGVRRTAVRTLSLVDDPRAREAIVRVANGDDLPRNRAEAVFFLTGRLDSARLLALGHSAMDRERNPHVRAAWLNAIGARAMEEGWPILESALRSDAEDVAVRGMAAELLAASGWIRIPSLLEDPTLPPEIRERLRTLEPGYRGAAAREDFE